jgi:hypothetical protein
MAPSPGSRLRLALASAPLEELGRDEKLALLVARRHDSDSGSMSTATVPSVYAFFRVMRTRPSGRGRRRSWATFWAQHVAQRRLAPPR